jgi:hypothetical protein
MDALPKPVVGAIVVLATSEKIGYCNIPEQGKKQLAIAFVTVSFGIYPLSRQDDDMKVPFQCRRFNCDPQSACRVWWPRLLLSFCCLLLASYVCVSLRHQCLNLRGLTVMKQSLGLNFK